MTNSYVLPRTDLKALVEGQRESVRLAEEGQEWVDAIAAEVQGVADATVANLRAAVDALRNTRTPNVEAVEEANDALAAALQDRKIRDSKANKSNRAAVAHRQVTVDRARERLVVYEQALAAKTDEEATKIITEYDARLHSEAERGACSS